MQTSLLPDLLKTNAGKRADEILRKCVHCGFCTATCPTYQLLGNELDSPRGRVYQVKMMLEGQPADRETLMHLDRCLTCRSCETTCPSGVDYAELIDIGRQHIEKEVLRPFNQRLLRKLLGRFLPYSTRHRWIFKLGSLFHPLLPEALKQKTPVIRPAKKFRLSDQYDTTRKTVLLLEGCVQSTLSPNTNAAAEAVLNALGYRVVREPQASCCGAVNQHLGQGEQAIHWIMGNLRQWETLNRSWRLDAIVSTASGCGVMLKDYAEILHHQHVDTSEFDQLLGKICDISELFDADRMIEKQPGFTADNASVAYHAPCTLNHGHRMADKLFQQLTSLGYQLIKPQDAHLCCGSAGTYSILQADISKQLRNDKLDKLLADFPEKIITANVGCEHHLNGATNIPVIHWIEMVADDLNR